MKIKIAFLLVFFLVSALMATETDKLSPLIIIYDSSGSMWGQINGKSKMEIAKKVLSETIEKLDDNQQIGLIAYGHRNETDCRDVEMLVQIENGTKETVIESLKGIKPLGKTPLAYSAEMVIDNLRSSGLKATVILITDGIESCDGDICEVIKLAKQEGIEFRLHIVGFGLKEVETEQLKCAAGYGDGDYFDADDAEGLSEVLKIATQSKVEEIANNYSVLAIKNEKPIDAYVEIFESGTTEIRKIVRTYADTVFFFLPGGKYDLHVKPLENSDVSALFIEGIESIENVSGHQTVSFDGAKIEINVLNNQEGWDSLVKLFSKETGKNVAQMRTYGRPGTMEVNPGIYDVEITALKIAGLQTKHTIKNIELKAGLLKKLEHRFKTGIAMIGVKSSSGLVDAVVNIREVGSGTHVAGGRTYTSDSSNPKKFLLNTGEYEVEIKALKEYAGTEEKFKITIIEGKTSERIIEI
jgi:Ca-activated chloride channel family protein